MSNAPSSEVSADGFDPDTFPGELMALLGRSAEYHQAVDEFAVPDPGMTQERRAQLFRIMAGA